MPSRPYIEHGLQVAHFAWRQTQRGEEHCDLQGLGTDAPVILGKLLIPGACPYSSLHRPGFPSGSKACWIRQGSLDFPLKSCNALLVSIETATFGGLKKGNGGNPVGSCVLCPEELRQSRASSGHLPSRVSKNNLRWEALKGKPAKISFPLVGGLVW